MPITLIMQIAAGVLFAGFVNWVITLIDANSKVMGYVARLLVFVVIVYFIYKGK